MPAAGLKIGICSILSRCLSITTDTEQSLASCSAILSRSVISRVTTSLYISHWILKINREVYLYTSCTPRFRLQSEIQQTSCTSLEYSNKSLQTCQNHCFFMQLPACLWRNNMTTQQRECHQRQKKTKGTITRKQKTVIELCETFNFAFVVKRTMSSSVPATLPSLFSGLW